MEYTVDYFIEKFEAIPLEKWTIGKFIDEEERCCALGHCGARKHQSLYGIVEARALNNLIIDKLHTSPTVINDLFYKGEETPKHRILRALKDIKNGTI